MHSNMSSRTEPSKRIGRSQNGTAPRETISEVTCSSMVKDMVPRRLYVLDVSTVCGLRRRQYLVRTRNMLIWTQQFRKHVKIISGTILVLGSVQADFFCFRTGWGPIPAKVPSNAPPKHCVKLVEWPRSGLLHATLRMWPTLS